MSILMPISQSQLLLFCSKFMDIIGEGNGTPLQCSCLENPMDGGAWWAAVHGVAKSRTRLSDFTFTFHFHALEKEMATHSSTLAWRIPGTGEPGGLPSMGLHRGGHDWSNLVVVVVWMLWRTLLWRFKYKFCSKFWNPLSVTSPTWLFFFKIALAIPGPLHFPMNFKINFFFPVYGKKKKRKQLGFW